jgi:IS605 OrfB family transposase
LAVGVGERRGRQRGYASGQERFEKHRRLQILERRLGAVEGRVADGRVSICRGGRRLARTREQLEAAGLTDTAWRERWVASRLFLTADGEADKAWGNETIRVHPDEEWLEIKLPAALAHLANRPHTRYRLSCPVGFPYRGDEVAAQAASGAIRYDLSHDPGKDRWYLGASWKTAQRDTPTLQELRGHPVLAVDLNAGHLAVVAVEASGSPLGVPVTIPLELGGLPTSTRDGRVRAAISELLRLATTHGCGAIVIEDLDFADAREQGRERCDRRPSRGQRGRSFRRAVAGIPTRRFRDRLVQMATNRGLAVVAVDPAYTSRWGAQYWLGALQQISPVASGHHAAALVIARRGLGQRARRRERCDSTPPEDGQERATNSAMRATPAQADLSQPRHRDPGSRKARGQPHQRHKTQRGERPIPGDQAAQDRSGPPAEQDSLLLSVQER